MFKKWLLEVEDYHQNDKQGFIRNIINNYPNNWQSNMLIYADWLEEHSDNETAEVYRVIASGKDVFHVKDVSFILSRTLRDSPTTTVVHPEMDTDRMTGEIHYDVDFEHTIKNIARYGEGDYFGVSTGYRGIKSPKKAAIFSFQKRSVGYNIGYNIEDVLLIYIVNVFSKKTLDMPEEVGKLLHILAKKIPA